MPKLATQQDEIEMHDELSTRSSKPGAPPYIPRKAPSSKSGPGHSLIFGRALAAHQPAPALNSHSKSCSLSPSQLTFSSASSFLQMPTEDHFSHRFVDNYFKAAQGVVVRVSSLKK
jgi:hypothetical protein